MGRSARSAQKSEVRSQKSEVRSQKSEVRSQKSEVRSRRSGISQSAQGAQREEFLTPRPPRKRRKTAKRRIILDCGGSPARHSSLSEGGTPLSATRLACQPSCPAKPWRSGKLLSEGGTGCNANSGTSRRNAKRRVKPRRRKAASSRLSPNNIFGRVAKAQAVLASRHPRHTSRIPSRYLKHKSRRLKVMVPFFCRFIALTLFASFIGLMATNVQAASGTWTNLTSGGLWSDANNWSGGVVADGSGFSAIFTNIDITTDI